MHHALLLGLLQGRRDLDQVKVLDFGLAKLARPVADTAATMSQTETPAAAGEAVAGRKPPTALVRHGLAVGGEEIP